MAQKLPEWLDKAFLEKALQGEEKDAKITVEDFSAALAVAAGNNYTSQIFRVHITYTSNESRGKTKTLIIKAPITQFQGGEFGLDALFSKEPIMYSQVLPKMTEKLREDFAAKTYYSAEKNVLVFQDLKEAGYVLVDKFKQLDYAHCELVFKRMAKFHAASVALHNENPEEIEKIGIEPVFTEGNPILAMFKPLTGLVIGMIAEILKKTEGGEPIAQILLGKQEKLVESNIAICKPKKNRLNVLNHGDLWNCNMLFKHTASGEVVDVKFIDYQAIRYMTPAIDILYFTWTSADEEVRESRLSQLYDIYLQTLNDSLELLGCKQRYSSEELWQDMRSSMDFALATVCQTLPMMLAESEDALDMTEFDMNEFKNMFSNSAVDPKMLRVYNGKQFKAKVPVILKQLIKTLQ